MILQRRLIMPMMNHCHMLSGRKNTVDDNNIGPLPHVGCQETYQRWITVTVTCWVPAGARNKAHSLF